MFGDDASHHSEMKLKKPSHIHFRKRSTDTSRSLTRTPFHFSASLPQGRPKELRKQSGNPPCIALFQPKPDFSLSSFNILFLLVYAFGN